MAKLAAVPAALLAGLLLVSLATATTTVTTVEVDEGDDNPYRNYGGDSERCREQLEEADELRHCEDFLREQAREGGFGRRDPYEVRGSRRLRNCCQQLRRMDDRCRCQGLREIAREQQQRQRGYGEAREELEREIAREQQQRQRGYGEAREELERIAENLPQLCGVSPGRCDIRRGGRWM